MPELSRRAPRPMVLFTVSGDARLGLGHVRRSRTVADLLPDALTPRFHAAQAAARRSLKAAGARLVSSLNVLSSAPAVVVFDRPREQSSELDAIRARWPRVPILAMDYFRRSGPTPDAVVNLYDHSGLRPSRGWLTGTSYAIIRPAFRRLRRRTAPRGVRRILLAFGSSDPKAHTLRVLKLLDRRATRRLTIDILTGALFPWRRRLEAAVASSRHDCRVHPARPEPAPLMARADLAFSGGGTTSLELCCLGVPTVVVPQTPEERRFAAFRARSGALLTLPDSARAAARMVESLLAEDASPILSRLHRLGKTSVDGRGAERIASLIAAMARV